MRDLASLDACAQAALVRAREVSPRELVESAIERIERVDGRLNAVIDKVYDAAVAASDDPSLPGGPLRGVPFLMKDIGATQVGVASWWGNRAARAHGERADADSELGARFRRAGLVTLGTSNCPEFAATPTCSALAHGPARNPWDTTRSPAGSSGGACVAVASGMVPVAHANDGGGSIRLPAAWCGLVGLKPTRGRVPTATVVRNSVELVVARTVRDVAAVLDAVGGATSADLWREAPFPGGTVVGTLDQPVPLRRVALLTESWAGVDPACAAAAEAAARTLEGWGATVERVSPEVLFTADAAANASLWTGGIARRIDALGERIGRPLTREEVEPYNWACAEAGWATTAAAWVAAQERQHTWAAGVHRWFDGFDLLVTPTTGTPPLPVLEMDPPDGDPLAVGFTYGKVAAFTLPFNVTGHPAISVPAEPTADGLPLGVHLVAPMGREDVLLRLAARFEAEHPWTQRVPPVHASHPTPHELSSHPEE
jgi:amidase